MSRRILDSYLRVTEVVRRNSFAVLQVLAHAKLNPMPLYGIRLGIRSRFNAQKIVKFRSPPDAFLV
jgi:hypothetical protein